jgi:hypothetical protein
MSVVGGLGAESVKGMGPGAYLVTVLPSAATVAMVFVLFNANVYPWTHPPAGTARGYESVTASVGDLDAAGTVTMVALVLLLAVLVRPLHVAAVQLLEGYWTARMPFGLVDSIAVERHLRRYGRAKARTLQGPRPERHAADFGAMVSASRLHRRVERRYLRAEEIIASYPANEMDVLPTGLGNILRRAETTAGERYELDTILTFPRLYPFLHPRLHAELATQFNLLDTAAAFAVVFWALSALSAPAVATGGWWFLLPLGLAVAGSVSYAGALVTAREHGTLLATSYDLHRFDMIKSLHLTPPPTPAKEREMNGRITAFLRYWSPDLPDIAWRSRAMTDEYDHTPSGEQSPEPTA